MEEYVLNLSRKFWDNYKLFLKEELTLRELEKSITNLSEAVFYQENCNHRFNLAIYAEKHINQNMKQFLGNLFLALKNLSPDSRKNILKNMITSCLNELARSGGINHPNCMQEKESWCLGLFF